jgi:hypothetical protein
VKLARELEQRLERLVEGLSATLFRGRMHPVDLANRLVRFVDLSVAQGASGPQIANHYEVRVSPGDVAVSVEILNGELSAAVRETAIERGWRTNGPTEVRLIPDRSIGAGGFRCSATEVPGPMPAWAHLIDRSGTMVHDITDNRVIIGRAVEVDIRVPHDRVSRRHASIYRSAGVTSIVDLGSANGTSVNGTRISTRGTQITPGDIVSVGPATFSFRLL